MKTPIDHTRQVPSQAELDRLGELMDKAWEEAGWDGANRPTAPVHRPEDWIDDVWENAGWDGANR